MPRGSRWSRRLAFLSDINHCVSCTTRCEAAMLLLTLGQALQNHAATAAAAGMLLVQQASVDDPSLPNLQAAFA